MNQTGVKWKSKDIAGRNVLHIVFGVLNEKKHKYIYFHIQRRLIDANTIVEHFNTEEYRILRKYKGLYYVEEVDGYLEETWIRVYEAINKLKLS